MKKTLTFIALACFALVFCGCLAKSKPAIKQYSLYTDKCSQIPVKITNVSSLPVLQNRNIIITHGINVKTFKFERKQSMMEIMMSKAADIKRTEAAAQLGLPVCVLEDWENGSMTPMYLYK